MSREPAESPVDASRFACRAAFLGALAVAASLALARPAAAGQAGVSLRPERLALGDTAELIFTIEHSQLRGVAVEPDFDVDNFTVVAGPVRRDSVTWINGELTRTLGLSWYLAPQRAGKARVHGIRLTVDGKVLDFPEQEAWVDDRAADEPEDAFSMLLRDLMPGRRWEPRQLGEPQILLRGELAPADPPWAGQQLLYTLYLLAERRREGEGRVQVETIFPRRVPQFQGFWSQEVPLPESSRAELVEHQGKLYWRQAILQRALFPYEPGVRRIEAAEADLRLVYYRPVGFGLAEEPVRPETARRTSNAIDVQVKTLPPPPSGFGGAVGRFRARATLAPAEVAAGEAATFTVELAGSGNLSGLPDPKLPAVAGLRLSPPQDVAAQRVEGKGVVSSRTWSWVVIPHQAGQWQLPAVEWPTFDPVSGRYETVTTTPQTLVAVPAPPAPAATGRPRVETVRFDALAWARQNLPLVAGAAAALAVLAGGLAVRRRRGGDAPARRRLLARLGALREEPPAPPRQAASAAEDAWREFLARRFEVPGDATPNQWPRLLAARGLEPSTTGELLRLVDDLHYLRYAPQLASTEALQRELWDRSRRLARRLA